MSEEADFPAGIVSGYDALYNAWKAAFETGDARSCESVRDARGGNCHELSTEQEGNFSFPALSGEYPLNSF